METVSRKTTVRQAHLQKTAQQNVLAPVLMVLPIQIHDTALQCVRPLGMLMGLSAPKVAQEARLHPTDQISVSLRVSTTHTGLHQVCVRLRVQVAHLPILPHGHVFRTVQHQPTIPMATQSITFVCWSVQLAITEPPTDSAKMTVIH